MNKSLVDQNWLISPFVLYAVPQSEHYFIYSHQASARIIHQSMINFLTEIKKNDIQKISHHDLEKLVKKHSLQYQNVVDFLVDEIRVLYPQPTKIIENLYLLTDNEHVAKNLAKHFTHMNVFLSFSQDIPPKNSLVLIYNQTYIKENYSSVLNLARSKQYQCYFVTAYIFHHFLMIDNIYHLQKGLPCHFCHLYREQQSLQSSSLLFSDSWFLFYRAFIQDFPHAVPSLPLSLVQENLVIFHLANFLQHFVLSSPNKLLFTETLNCLYVDLITGEPRIKQAQPWSLCECNLYDIKKA